MFASNVGVVPSSRRFARITVVVSVLLHATVGLGLLAVSFWKISKLTPRHEAVVLRTGGSLPPGDPAPAQAAPAERKPKRPPQKPEKLVQPNPEHPAAKSLEPAAATSTDSTGRGDGEGRGGGGDDDGDGTGIVGLGTGDGQPQIVPDIPPAPTPPRPAAHVGQESIEGQRISGTKHILLPASVLSTLRNQGVSAVTASAQMCIDESGAPASIKFRESSSYSEVDGVLLREMQKWRYRPYVVNGEPVRACFFVVFRYRITD